MLTNYSFGEYSFEAPSSWAVTEADGGIELVQSDGQGAVHISFLNRSEVLPPSDADALLLVEKFASNNSLLRCGEIETVVLGIGVRAIGEFRPAVRKSDTPLHWILASIVWRDKAIRVSYCTDVLEEEQLKLVKSVIGSIGRSSS